LKQLDYVEVIGMPGWAMTQILFCRMCQAMSLLEVFQQLAA
jgi:hypothetical protein